MLSTLLENKKFAQATHNIYAYRVLKDGLPGCMAQDCEDDGENAAGSRLLHLLQLVKLIHKMVVVIPDLCVSQRSAELKSRMILSSSCGHSMRIQDHGILRASSDTGFMSIATSLTEKSLYRRICHTPTTFTNSSCTCRAGH
ncbi:hypothetical protein J6590_105333 [Homalodisca vitripennis]|nr:hypothetical protein J6590_105333 [Homalodisca vitripennis]